MVRGKLGLLIWPDEILGGGGWIKYSVTPVLLESCQLCNID